jgi:hypothetical protein
VTPSPKPPQTVDERVKAAGIGGCAAGFLAGMLAALAFVQLLQHLQLGWR